MSAIEQLKAKQSAVSSYGAGGRAAGGYGGGYGARAGSSGARPHTAPGKTLGGGGGAAKPWEKLARETATAKHQDTSADDFDDDF